ncbi:MAG: zinc ribbon domain-containing protein [candidate division WOR-3 bacterium]
MPIYEYECKDCKKTFEVLIFNKKEEKQLCCPKCGKKNITLLISTFGVAGTDKKVSSSSCNTCTTKSCATCR